MARRAGNNAAAIATPTIPPDAISMLMGSCGLIPYSCDPMMRVNIHVAPPGVIP